MPKITFTETDIYYETHGSGGPLVLIPGFASGVWSWAWQVEDLSEDFRVITFDPRGVSNSAIKEGALVSIMSIADDVAELLDALAIASAHVLGISFGGFVAQEFALKYPKKLKKLILASTSFGGPKHVPPSPDVLEAFASTEGLNSSDRIRRYLATAFSPEFVRDNGDAVDRFCRLREENVVPENVYLQQLQSATTFNAESRLQNIGAETLVITGDGDKVVPMQNAVNLAKMLPKVRLEIIRNVGHMAFVERAGEFNKIVHDFLI